MIFVYFTYTNYDSAITQAFISLSPDSGNCNTVPISITASYYADIHGHWEGTAEFDYYQSSYQFQFSSFSVSSMSQYQRMMQTYLESLQSWGQISAQENLGVNIILWMSLIRFYSVADPTITDFVGIGSGNLQYLTLSGDPSVVYNGRYSGLALGSPDGFCKIPSLVVYDEANANFRAMIRTDVFVNSTTCSAVTTPFIFSNQNSFNAYFAITLDVRAFSTAMAVNLGYLDIHDLQIASGSVLKMQLKNTFYEIGQYFDVRYPRMTPIYCFKNISEIPASDPQIDSLCIMGSGTGLFLPVSNHMGNNLRVPTYCDCNDPAVGRSDTCNSFFLMAGLIAFPVNVTSSFLEPTTVTALLKYAFQLVAMYGADYRVLNKAAFKAQSLSTLVALGSAAPQVKQASYVKDAFEFCYLPAEGIHCSVLSFYTLDEDTTVSNYHYPLVNGSCRDALTISDSAWSNIANAPPTPIVQDYYECLPTQSDALLNAVGVASGNTSIAMLLLLFFCVPLVFGLMACCRRIPREQEYPEKDKQRTLDTLATLILRHRDAHYEAIKPTSELGKVTQELLRATVYCHQRDQKQLPQKTGISPGSPTREGGTNSPEKGGSSKYLVKEGEAEEQQKQKPAELPPPNKLLGKMLIYRHKHTDNNNKELQQQLMWSADSFESSMSRSKSAKKMARKRDKQSPYRSLSLDDEESHRYGSRSVVGDLEMTNGSPETKPFPTFSKSFLFSFVHS
jgi:hypothetical protein